MRFPKAEPLVRDSVSDAPTVQAAGAARLAGGRYAELDEVPDYPYFKPVLERGQAICFIICFRKMATK